MRRFLRFLINRTMPDAPNPSSPSPLTGARCVFGPGATGPEWMWGTIRNVNADGTFKVEPDVKAMVLMPFWHGITPAELSIDDSELWMKTYPRLCGDGDSLSRSACHAAFKRLGFEVGDDQMSELWSKKLADLFSVPV